MSQRRSSAQKSVDLVFGKPERAKETAQMSCFWAVDFVLFDIALNIAIFGGRVGPAFAGV